MKIVQISPYAMSRPGGVQTHVRDLSHWLRGQGHAVRVLCPPGDGTLQGGWEEIGHHRNMSLHDTGFEVSRASRPALASKLADLRDWGAEAVHLHTPWTPMLAWQLWRGLALPTVATLHATLPEGGGFDPFRWYIRSAARYFARRVSAVVVPSQAPFDQWHAMGLTPDLILPPAIDLAAWAARAAPTASGPFRAAYLGRLEDRKGVHLLPQTWQTVRSALPDAELTIAGSGPLEATLKAETTNKAIKGISFIPAPPDAEARALVAAADLLLAPALHGESFGLVLVESLAAGTPPLAAANPGYATVMTGKGRSLLVPPNDASAMAARIIALAQNPAELAALRDWGQAHAATFDISAQGPALVDLFRKAIEG